MVQLATGVRDVGRGFDVLRAHPRLWKYVLAPAAITLVLVVALVIAVVRLIDPLSGWVVGHVPWLEDLAGSLLTALLDTAVAVGLSIGALFVFVTVAGMFAGPFNEMLSEHIEAELTGARPAPFALGAFLHGLVLGVLHGLRRLLAALVGLVLVFVLGFIPVVGTIAAVLLGAWLTARGAAYDSYDAVLARRSLGYRAKLDYLARHRQRTLGLGAAVAGMLLVPGLNLIALGLGAAGATVAAHALEGAPAQAGRAGATRRLQG